MQSVIKLKNFKNEKYNTQLIIKKNLININVNNFSQNVSYTIESKSGISKLIENFNNYNKYCFFKQIITFHLIACILKKI